MSAFGGMEQSESLIGTKGGMCHEYKSNIPLFSRNGMRYVQFYRIPKLLFTSEYFKNLSCEAKVLYGLMLDRMSLSIKNRWFDEEDRAYIFFEVEFQMKAGMDILKELEEFYMLEKETEKSDARKVAVLMKGYLQSMKSNIREIIRYIDDTTLEKSNDKKKDKQESASTISEKVQVFVNLTFT